MCLTTPQLSAQRDTTGLSIYGDYFFALQVENVTEAAEWYSSVFGLHIANQLDAEDGSLHIRLLTGRGVTLELIESRRAVAAPEGYQHGIFKVGFYSTNIESDLHWLRSQGTDVDERIFHDTALRARTFTFRDPWGNRLQIFQACPACD